MTLGPPADEIAVIALADRQVGCATLRSWNLRPIPFVSKDASHTDRATVIAAHEAETPMPRPPSLIVVSGVFLGHQMDLGDAPVIIGRATEADLSLPHPSVSRSHCRIWREDERYFIEDLGATNKTYLNGRVIDKAELRDGDQIGIGNHALKFFSGNSAEASYHQELIELAVHDSLTGFYNRRHFRTLLDEDIERAKAGETLSLIIIDLDHFKRVNDSFGHLVGDQVLSSVSQLIREMSPQTYRLGRLGGEEFAVALPGVAMAEATEMAERYRAGVQAHHFDIRGQRYPITTSLGVAQWTGGMAGSADLLRLADERLYRAKGNGRNRVEA